LNCSTQDILRYIQKPCRSILEVRREHLISGFETLAISLRKCEVNELVLFLVRMMEKKITLSPVNEIIDLKSFDMKE